jgi:hypothetical protein
VQSFRAAPPPAGKTARIRTAPARIAGDDGANESALGKGGWSNRPSYDPVHAQAAKLGRVRFNSPNYEQGACMQYIFCESADLSDPLLAMLFAENEFSEIDEMKSNREAGCHLTRPSKSAYRRCARLRRGSRLPGWH